MDPNRDTRPSPHDVRITDPTERTHDDLFGFHPGVEGIGVRTMDVKSEKNGKG